MKTFSNEYLIQFQGYKMKSNVNFFINQVQIKFIFKQKKPNVTQKFNLQIM